MTVGLIGFAMSDDNTQDWYLDDGGNIALSTGANCMSDNIETSCKLWLREYEYDTTIGIPYLTIFGNPHINNSFLKTQYSRAILSPNDYLTQTQYTQFGISVIDTLDFALNTAIRDLTIKSNVLLNNNSLLGINVNVGN